MESAAITDAAESATCSFCAERVRRDVRSGKVMGSATGKCRRHVRENQHPVGFTCTWTRALHPRSQRNHLSSKKMLNMDVHTRYSIRLLSELRVSLQVFSTYCPLDELNISVFSIDDRVLTHREEGRFIWTVFVKK